MHNQTLSDRLQTTVASGSISASKALSLSVKSWFIIALAGQWLFALYIGVSYGVPLLKGNYAIELSSAGSHGLLNPHESIKYLAHVLPAIWLSLGGILQFSESIRRRVPKFHRINGRVILTLGILGAFTGLYLTWWQDIRPSNLGAIGVTINGLLIPLFVFMAWRYAIARNIPVHRRWAVHCFLLFNGVWTFRLYLFGWYMLNQGANGNTAELDGPVDLFISVACYALPMIVAECVFWAHRQQSKYRQWFVASVMFFGCLITIFGIASVSMANWLPAITG